MRYLLFILLLASCAVHTDPNDTISFSQAFHYCTTLGGYWTWVALASVAGLAIGVVLYLKYRREQSWTTGMSLALVAALCIVVASFLYLPCEIAANTTVEQAAMGVYIGR